jgi:Ca-activated chloride channel family protein
MRFAEPQMLAFLALALAVIGGVVAAAALRRRALARFGAAAAVDPQLRRPHPYLRAAKAIALTLGVAGLALAAARPQYGGRIQMLKKRGIDIVVALDFSKSMLAQDVRPSRIARAKLELNELINLLTGDRIGLVAFAGDTMRFPLTTDYAAAIAFWRDLTPYDMPVGGTAIGKALTAGVRMLRPLGEDADPLKTAEPARSKVIVLLTDGEDHVGDPAAAADEAAEQGIAVYTVGFGSDSPELIPRYLDDGTTMGYQKDDSGEYVTTALTPANEDALKAIAAKTGGRYYRAGADLSGIGAVVDEIRKMKQTEVEARQITVYDEVFQWFLAPAALLMLLAFALPERWTRKRRER